MTVLLLRLAGPMQSWGSDSRFSRRDTLRYPTKSGVLGLLAAAKGLRRTDSIEDLLGLRFGVRVDQPGRVMSDFHTAHNWRTGASMPLSTRYYLADAVFLAGVEGEPQLLESLHEALLRPRFLLFLGRRSCPASGRVTLGVHDGPLEPVLRETAWQASGWYRRQQGRSVPLPLYLDAGVEAGSADLIRDAPISFDPRRRAHGWRRVANEVITVENPAGRESGVDFFAAIGGL
jgi:CRISPR system Cascade subunit CasD